MNEPVSSGENVGIPDDLPPVPSKPEKSPEVGKTSPDALSEPVPDTSPLQDDKVDKQADESVDILKQDDEQAEPLKIPWKEARTFKVDQKLDKIEIKGKWQEKDKREDKGVKDCNA